MHKSKSCGDLYTMKEWIEMVENRYFTDIDGFGEYSDGEFVYEKFVNPSQLRENKVDKSWSHVMWYNR